jgi:threonine/homoserine/homoserine lactone efflux protein
LELPPLLEGIAFGLAIAAPVGPIGLLCIRRTLASGRACGFVSGMGAATADMFYGAVAAFGLSAISTVLLKHQDFFRLAGGLFLGYLGVRTFIAKPAEDSGAKIESVAGLLAAYSSTLLLTLMNPATILSFIAIFSGIGPQRKSIAAAAALVGGVFLGSAFWWLLLSSGVSLLRGSLSARGMRWINRISGMCLLGFGAAALVALFRA